MKLKEHYNDTEKRNLHQQSNRSDNGMHVQAALIFKNLDIFLDLVG